MLPRLLLRAAAGVLFVIGVCVSVALTGEGAPAEDSRCRAGPVAVTGEPRACWRPFSSASPFNRKLPAEPRQVMASARMAAATTAFAPAPSFEVGQEGTADDFNHPVYFSKPGDPVYRVVCRAFGGDCEISGMRVRIPRDAAPAGGSDGHLGVIDRKSGWNYDFWQVRERSPDGGRLVVSFGGRTEVNTPTADGLGSNATAAHFATSAGAIRPGQLRAGLIDHALFMTVECTSGRSVWPAGSGVGRPCSAIGLPNKTAPAMGQHFYLDMSKREIRNLDVPRWQKTILVAMADYGLYVGDTGGVGWGLKLWTGLGAPGRPNPWIELAKDLRVPTYVADDGTTRYVFDMKQTLDWGSRLRVAAQCVSRRTC